MKASRDLGQRLRTAATRGPRAVRSLLITHVVATILIIAVEVFVIAALPSGGPYRWILGAGLAFVFVRAVIDFTAYRRWVSSRPSRTGTAS